MFTEWTQSFIASHDGLLEKWVNDKPTVSVSLPFYCDMFSLKQRHDSWCLALQNTRVHIFYTFWDDEYGLNAEFNNSFIHYTLSTASVLCKLGEKLHGLAVVEGDVEIVLVGFHDSWFLQAVSSMAIQLSLFYTFQWSFILNSWLHPISNANVVYQDFELLITIGH